MFCFLQVELKRLEDLSESIVQDFNYMRQREVGGDDGLDRMILKFKILRRRCETRTKIPTVEFSTSQSSQCAVSLAWLPGRFVQQASGNIRFYFPSFRFCI